MYLDHDYMTGCNLTDYEIELYCESFVRVKLFFRQFS